MCLMFGHFIDSSQRHTKKNEKWKKSTTSEFGKSENTKSGVVK